MTRFRVTLTSRGAVLLIVLGFGLLFLWTIRPVLPPLIWAFVVAYVFDPVIDRLSRIFRVRRGFVVALMFALIVGALTWAVFAVRPILVRELHDLTLAVPRIVDSVQAFTVGSGPLDILGFPIDITDLKDELNKGIRDVMTGMSRQAIPFVLRAVSSLVSTILFLISTFYLLMDMDKVGPAIVKSLPRRWRTHVIPLLTNMESVLGRYIRGQVILIAIQMVAAWVVLTALQMPYALLLALVTGVVEIFPVIGPWTAGAMVVSVALTQDTALFGGNSAYLALAVAAAYLIMRQLEDVFIIPNVVGKVMEMHPLLVLFSLTAGGYLAGMLGVLIAVPIAATVKLCLGYLRDQLAEEDVAYGAAHQPVAAGASAGDADDES